MIQLIHEEFLFNIIYQTPTKRSWVSWQESNKVISIIKKKIKKMQHLPFHLPKEKEKKHVKRKRKGLDGKCTTFSSFNKDVCSFAHDEKRSIGQIQIIYNDVGPIFAIKRALVSHFLCTEYIYNDSFFFFLKNRK